MSEKNRESWKDLEQLVQDEDFEGTQALLDGTPPTETARMVSRLSDEDQEQLLSSLPPDVAADVVDELPGAQSAELVERLEPDAAAAILHELPSDERADILTAMSDDDAARILDELSPEEGQATRQLIEYEADTAGGLMATEFLAYDEDLPVADVVADLRRRADEYEDEETQYLYVQSGTGQLVGVLRVRDLLFASGRRKVGAIMIEGPASVAPDASLNELASLFDRHWFLGLPVVDKDNHLLGVVQRADVEEALSERNEGVYLRAQGIVGGEELRTMPTWLRSARRLSWLTPNIVLNLIAASVIAFFQDTITSVVALAFFLPVISDMSGCSGNQAVAVSIRELSLGMIKPTELFYVWRKEIRVGLVNGLALGCLISLAAWAWQGNGMLGLVVGGALFLNTLVAVSIGGGIPLLLRRFGLDPALASGPILTTVTDMCGFFLLLSLATVTLEHIAVT